MQQLRLLILASFFVLLIAFIICFYFIANINTILLQPLFSIFAKYNLPNFVISTNLTDVFFSNIKLAFYSAIFIVLPIILLLIYFYILSALKQNEKNIALIILLGTPLLFWLGLFIAYYFGFNVVLNFFISYSVANNINIMPKLIEYIGLMLQVLLLFGLSFQLPIVLLILGLLQIITAKNLLQFFKFAVVIAFVIGAVFTPPDPLSQIIMAGVLILLYLSSYVLLKLLKL